jgi:hypothetical protein
MGLQEELIATERSLWTNRPDVYQATFTSEAILVFPETGKIGRSDKDRSSPCEWSAA